MTGSHDPDVSDLVTVIAVLWGEIPLRSEHHVLELLRRQGVYDAWEWALDAQMTS